MTFPENLKGLEDLSGFSLYDYASTILRKMDRLSLIGSFCDHCYCVPDRSLSSIHPAKFVQNFAFWRPAHF